MYDELAFGSRLVGPSVLHYKDVCKRHMKALDINIKSWEATAADATADGAQRALETVDDERGEDSEPG